MKEELDYDLLMIPLDGDDYRWRVIHMASASHGFRNILEVMPDYCWRRRLICNYLGWRHIVRTA